MAELALPFAVVAVVFSPSSHLAIATDDGSIRVYQKPYAKAWKAVRNLGSEVSSVAFAQDSSSTSLHLWAAYGQHVACFELFSDSLILQRRDAVFETRLTEEEDDVVNQINVNKSHLVYTLDSGVVGTLDLKTKERTIMKTRHSSLCTNVSFIPERPRELVSVGYDFNVFHFDFQLGNMLSSFKIESPAEPPAQISLSPPFIQCLSISPNGIIACGLADGMIWLGFGGEKTLVHRRKRRKWDGLRRDSCSYVQVADGPVVGIEFINSNRLVALSLLGNLTLFEVLEGKLGNKLCSQTIKGLLKANELVVDGSDIWIGGIAPGGKGIALSVNVDSLREENEA